MLIFAPSAITIKNLDKMQTASHEKIVKQFIKFTNAADLKSALALFAKDAVIDDVSVGEKFKNLTGVRIYLDKFFVGYNTVTRLESFEIINDEQVSAQVDFTGDFGHETGALNFTINEEGLIAHIDAHLD